MAKTYSYDSDIEIRGWALNASYVDSIKINIDDTPIEVNVSINTSSIDVNRAYPNYPYSNNARFNGTIPASLLTNGTHKIYNCNW